MRDGSTSTVYDINDNYKKLYEKNVIILAI